MSHGATWGSLWGGGAFFAETIGDRLLMFVRGARFQALVQTFASRTEALVEVARQITEAFGLDTAVGVQLDRLGAILQLPRGPGVTDDSYRLLLRVQVLLILSSTATTETLLEIVLQVTGAEAPTYFETHPAHIGIGAIATGSTAVLLAQLLRRAKAGGVRLDLQTQAGVNVLLVDTDDNVVADPGTVDTTLGDEGADAYPIVAVEVI